MNKVILLSADPDNEIGRYWFSYDMTDFGVFIDSENLIFVNEDLVDWNYHQVQEIKKSVIGIISQYQPVSSNLAFTI